MNIFLIYKIQVFLQLLKKNGVGPAARDKTRTVQQRKLLSGVIMFGSRIRSKRFRIHHNCTRDSYNSELIPDVPGSVAF